MILSCLLICPPFLTSIYFSFITFQPFYLGFCLYYILHFYLSISQSHFCLNPQADLIFALIIWLDLSFFPNRLAGSLSLP